MMEDAHSSLGLMWDLNLSVAAVQLYPSNVFTYVLVQKLHQHLNSTSLVSLRPECDPRVIFIIIFFVITP